MSAGRTNKIFFLSLVFSLLSLYCYGHSEASFQEREKISVSSFTKAADIRAMQDYLSGGDILNYFKVRERLLSLPYERLLELTESLCVDRSLGRLSDLAQGVLAEREAQDILYLMEDIFVDNRPLTADSPFYPGAGKDLRITELKPHSEHLYFYNLRLRYRKNNLLRKNDSLWVAPRQVGLRARHRTARPEGGLRLEDMDEKASCLFSYKLKGDNRTNFTFSLRQWFKGYEEGAAYPVVYKDTLLVRNEYRLFCLDLLTGSEIWSLGDPRREECEFYQTLRHPHHNSYGSELLIDGDTVFTELDGQLMAIGLKDALAPSISWKRDLGEYTVCTKPVMNGGVLIAGLINARQELWLCGFNPGSGDLEWNTYIGMSSFLSPVCMLSASEGNRTYIGTNHGVLVSLDAGSGRIIWVKKYTPRKYEDTEFWTEDYYQDSFIDKGFVKYDTQFLELTDGGTLYYKPRESDYLYILDPISGESIEEILIDSERHYILRASEGKAVLLERKSASSGDPKLQVVDLGSGQKIYESLIAGDSLKGVHYIDAKNTLFKSGDTVYALRMGADKIEKMRIGVPFGGWLLGSYGRFLFTGENNELHCLDAYDAGKYPYAAAASRNTGPLRERDELKDNLTRAVRMHAASPEAGRLREVIAAGMNTGLFRFDENIDIILKNMERLRAPEWGPLLSRLRNLYGDRMVIFRDVRMRFSNFLARAGLINPALAPSGEPEEVAIGHNAGAGGNYKVKGERISLVPLDIMKGQKPADFFLLLNFDQVICVSEEGRIRWHRKVFYNNPVRIYFINIPQDLNIGRLFTDKIEAYLYGNALIINDSVNLIAVNADSGEYIWGMTNGKEVFEEEKKGLFNPYLLHPRYGYKESCLKKISFYAGYLYDRLIVTHGNKIYSLDPETGFCEKSAKLNVAAVLQMKISADKIYILPYSLDRILVFDRDLKLRKTVSLDFIDKEDAYPELDFVKDDILVHIDSDVYVIDQRGMLKDKIRIENEGSFYIESHNGDFLAITPLYKVSCYSLGKGSPKVKWEFAGAPFQKDTIRSSHAAKTGYYFIIGERMLFPYKTGEGHSMVALDLATGAKLWDRPLGGVKGYFHNLTGYEEIGGAATFIISTCCGEFSGEDAVACSGAVLVNIYSKLFGLDIETGQTVRVRKLQTIPLWKKGVSLAQTENYFVYTYNKILNCIVKK